MFPLNFITAVDIWASGIILISILSGRCPFFPAIHDLESLVILMSVFGTKKIEDMAKSCGKETKHFKIPFPLFEIDYYLIF